MERQDTTEYLAVLAVGAVLGVGAVLLFRPAHRSRTQRIVRDLKPYGKRIRKRAHRARAAMESGASAAAERSSTLAESGASVLREFADQLLEMAATAREEVAEMIASQLADAREAARRGAARVRD